MKQTERKSRQKRRIEVLKNALSQNEGDQIAERLFESKLPNMTMDEVLTYAANKGKVGQIDE